MAAPRRRGGGASSSSESDGPRRKIHRSDRDRAGYASPDDRRGRNSKMPDAPDSRVSSHRDRERRWKTRPSSDEDSDSESRGRRRRSMDKSRKPRRRGDVSSDDDRRENRDMRREEALPPPPPLPPPPRMPCASSGRGARVSSGEERGDRERGREGRRDRERGIEGRDVDNDSEGHRRERRSKEEHRKRHRHDDVSSDDDRRENRDLEPKQRGSDKDIQREESLPPPPPLTTTASLGHHSQVSSGEGRRDREGVREGHRDDERGIEGRDEDSGSEGRGRGGRLEERHKGRRVDDGSSEDEDRRREIRDIRAERYRWSDDSSSPHNRDSRNLEVPERGGAVNDAREEEALPPPPPGPPPKLLAGARRDSRLSSRLRGEGRSSDGDSGSDDQGRERRLKDPRRYDDSSSDDDDHRRENRDRKRERNRRPDDGNSPPLRKQDRENHNNARDLGEAKQREAGNNVRKEEDLPPPPPLPPMRNNDRDREGRREGHPSSDDDSDSDGRGRGRRLKEERRKRERYRHSDESSDDDDRRRGRRDRKRERNRRSDEENRERGHLNSRRKRDSNTRNSDQDTRKEEPLPPPPPLPPMPDALAGRTGGIYIPPFRMAQMMKEVEDKSSEAYQRLSWDALRKSINGLVNKVNATNIKNIIPELLSENLIRGRGLFCRSCMKSQMASPGFTDVFSALVAVVNTKFPDLGKLLLKRIVLQLKRAYKRNDKPQLLAATKFIAHLVNQQVAHEIIALELLTLLLENPTDDSVEVAVGFVKECGAILQDLSPQGLYGIFERFRGILHEAELDKRVRYLIEDLFGIRRAKFEGYPAVRPELDLVEQEDQCIHEISLEDDDIDPETNLDVFKSNPNFLDDEKAYENLKRNILGDESSEDDGSEAVSEDDEEEESEEDEEKMEIRDETETNLVNLRRTIYLTIMSSVDFEEAGHKLLKIKLEPGQEMELCIMLLECCSQERTYLRYYGLLGQRFCMINRVHQENFETCFVQQYSMIHRLETNKLRNVAKFFAHLLGTSALPWHVLAYIRLTEEDTTSSSRIFIKILFQELSEHLGIRLLNERLNDPLMQESFESIFPKDNPKNTRFSINFFTSIGLGGITESLREYLKNMPRLIMQQSKPVADSDKSGSSSSSSSASSSDSESDSESDSSSDESERRRKRRRK